MPIKSFRQFIKLESAGGIILFSVAILALLIDNSPLQAIYEATFKTPFTIQYGIFELSKSLTEWINEGLMTIFFLLVGLEIKREILEGELNSVSKVILPAIAALGGMIVPSLIYVVINWGNFTALRGWAIPTATDIAFALGILSLLGNRVPVSLKMFLTALAIFDDIGAIIIIAFFYSGHISFLYLGLSALCLLALLLLNYFQIKTLSLYLMFGFVLWFLVMQSGVDAVLAGVALALVIPLRGKELRHPSPLRTLERRLLPWSAFLILPLFGFANAGVSLQGVGLPKLLNPISIGIAAGLFLGKQWGVFGAIWLAVKTKIVKMPDNANWKRIYAIALICGVGFTMSLFIGTLAFHQIDNMYVASMRMGVLMGSLVSGLMGYILLRRMGQAA